MLLRNISRIVVDNYCSLVDEVEGSRRISIVAVILGFGAIPVLIGFLFGYYIPIWTGFVGSLIPVIGVLTGFSLNSIVLLTGHSEEDSYDLKTTVVKQTKDYTLYSILVGLLLLSCLTFGFLLARKASTTVEISGTLISAVQLISGVIYAVFVHYVLILAVITHRLYTLVHGNAIGNTE